MDNYFDSLSKNFKVRFFTAHKPTFHCKVLHKLKFCVILKHDVLVLNSFQCYTK